MLNRPTFGGHITNFRDYYFVEWRFIGLSIPIIFCTIAIILPHKVVEMVAIKEV